jgi:hypothetical protein
MGKVPARANAKPVPGCGGFRGLTERTAGRRVPDRQDRQPRPGRSLQRWVRVLRGFGRDAFVAPDASREDATGREQDVDEAKLLRLGHAPRMHVLTTDSIGVVLLTLKHCDACATASQGQREGRTSIPPPTITTLLCSVTVDLPGRTTKRLTPRSAA